MPTLLSLSKRCTVEWEMSHSTVRLGNGSSMLPPNSTAWNLSPENRFEASPLRGDSTATGTFRRSARIDGNEWQFPRAYRRYTAGVSERAYVEANCGAPRRRSGERKLMFKQACCLWDHPQKLVWSWPKGKRLSSAGRRGDRIDLLHRVMSALGTKRTYRHDLLIVGFWGKADIRRSRWLR